MSLRAPRRALALVAALLAALAFPGAALADGDPASDVLLASDLYAPFQPRLPKPRADQLKDVLAQTRRQGYHIKVALIASKADLGAYPVLFGQTERYVHLLSREIRFSFKRGALLVVQPQGAVVVQLPRGQKRAERALQGLTVQARKGPTIGPGFQSYNPDDLAAAALRGIQRLAAAEGVTVEVPPLAVSKASRKPASDGSSISWQELVLAGALGVLVLGAVVFAVRSMRRPREVE